MDRLYQVKLSTEACRDLETAVNWIKEDSVDAAQRFFSCMRSTIQTNLSNTPHMGTRLQDIDGYSLFALTSNQYRVFYTVDDERRTVSVVRILHTSRDIQSILKLAA